MGGTRLTVTWQAPVTVSVSIDRLRHDAISIGDQGGELVQFSIGERVAIALTPASGGPDIVIRGADLTDALIDGIVSVSRTGGAERLDAPTASAPSATAETTDDVEATIIGTVAPAAAPAITDDDEATIIRSPLAPPAAFYDLDDLDEATIIQAPRLSVEGFDPTIAQPNVLPPLPPAPAGFGQLDGFAEVDDAFVPDPVVESFVVQVNDIANAVAHTVHGILFVGRAPIAPPETAGTRAALAVVSSPTEMVSATHLQLRLAGQQLLARDLWSTNGTMVVPPLGGSYRLGPGEEIPILEGSRLELGDAVAVTVIGANRGA